MRCSHSGQRRSRRGLCPLAVGLAVGLAVRLAVGMAVGVAVGLAVGFAAARDHGRSSFSFLFILRKQSCACTPMQIESAMPLGSMGGDVAR